MSLRDHAWHVLNDPSDPRYRVLHYWFINPLIVIASVIVIYDAVVRPLDRMPDWMRLIENGILIVFLIEFVGRLWVIRDWLPQTVRLTPFEKIKYFVVSRLRFVFSPWGFIDFLAILPLFPFMRSLRILRLLRLLRSVTFFRYANPLRTLTTAFRDNSLLFGVAMSFVIGSIVLSGLMFYLAEIGHNENVQGLDDTLWWAIVTVSTVGFGDITPQTAGGKVIGAALMLAGMFIIAMFAGVISSTLVGQLMPLRLEQVRMSSISDHVVIAGWSAEVPVILEEMKTEYGEDMPKVIVFAPIDRPANLPEEYVFVQGDFTKELELEKVRLKYAQTVLVVADESSGSVKPALRDASTVLTVFTIRSYERKLGEERTRKLHVVAEIRDSENSEHALVAGADEVIDTTRVGSGLLAHTTGNPGVGGVISSLVLASRNNIYSAPLPSDLIEGKQLSFAEVQDRARDSHHITVIGLMHAGKMVLNPPGDAPVYVGDKIVYVGPKSIQ